MSCSARCFAGSHYDPGQGRDRTRPQELGREKSDDSGTEVRTDLPTLAAGA